MHLPALLILLMLLPMSGHPAQPVAVVTSSEWARPRDGVGITRLAGLQQAMRTLLSSREGRIVVRYPGGEEGILWAEELRSWLVALGVASSQIELVPGAERADAIELSPARPTRW